MTKLFKTSGCSSTVKFFKMPQTRLHDHTVNNNIFFSPWLDSVEKIDKKW